MPFRRCSSASPPPPPRFFAFAPGVAKNKAVNKTDKVIVVRVFILSYLTLTFARFRAYKRANFCQCDSYCQCGSHLRNRAAVAISVFMDTHARRLSRGYGAVFATIGIWSLPSLFQFYLNRFYDPWSQNFYRYTVACLAIIPFVLFQFGRGPKIDIRAAALCLVPCLPNV